jgi:hypothetical protein
MRHGHSAGLGSLHSCQTARRWQFRIVRAMSRETLVPRRKVMSPAIAGQIVACKGCLASPFGAGYTRVRIQIPHCLSGTPGKRCH